MDWVSLEGSDRVLVAFREWKYCCRILRHARKARAPRHIRKFFKQDMLYEYDELIYSILSLTPLQSQNLLNSIHNPLLYFLVLHFSRS